MTLEATSSLLHLDTELPVDDTERIELVMSTVADYLDRDWIRTKWHRGRIQRLSPPAFRYRLIERAHAANRRIVLPEGAEPRTVQAAAICHERGIARCVLLGKPALIRRAAADQGVELPSEIEIIDPETVVERYLGPLLERRKHKGLTEIEGINQLHDEVILGTLMLAVGDVDGLVSGAVHTTADTVRPALQLVKTAPGVRLVSSVFFMCLPDQVLVYGDCAIDPHPSAEELADIALQSAASAESFGIEPRVALISYSTGTSGSGAEVAKVREATALARARRPDLLIRRTSAVRRGGHAGRRVRESPRKPGRGTCDRDCISRSQYGEHNVQGRAAIGESRLHWPDAARACQASQRPFARRAGGRYRLHDCAHRNSIRSVYVNRLIRLLKSARRSGGREARPR